MTQELDQPELLKNRPQSKLNLAFKVGTITGVGLAVLYVILYILDLSTSKLAGLISWVIVGGGIVYAIQGYKKVHQGFISYGSGLGIGTLTSLFAGIISAISYYALLLFDSGIISKIQEEQLEQLEEKGLNEEAIELSMQMAEKFMTPEYLAGFGLIGTLVLGFILSLIIAAIMKKKRSYFE